MWSVNGEVGAFKISQLIGVDFVPPTVKRVINGRAGSLQLYIQSNYNPNKMSGKHKRELFNSLLDKQKSDFALLHYLTGQWDRHWGNLIISNKKIFSIDNEVTSDHFVSLYGEYPFLRRGNRANSREEYKYDDLINFPFHEAIEVTNLSLINLKHIFKNYMESEKINKYYKKLKQKKLKSFFYLIWKGHLWLQAPPKILGPAHTKTYSQQTLELIDKLEKDEVSLLLKGEFSKTWIEEFFVRKNQILDAAKHGEFIP